MGEPWLLAIDLGTGGPKTAAVSLGGDLEVQDWTNEHANFFRSISITKRILFFVLSLMVAVAAFNIVSTMVMVVKDKRRDIAILRTFGSSPLMARMVSVDSRSCSACARSVARSCLALEPAARASGMASRYSAQALAVRPVFS